MQTAAAGSSNQFLHSRQGAGQGDELGSGVGWERVGGSIELVIKLNEE